MIENAKKMIIRGKEYSFKMTNNTILKIDEQFGNYGDALYGIMEGKKFYTNSLKLMACSCIEKEWQLEELTEQLTPKQMNDEVPTFAVELYLQYIGVEESKEGKEEKN